MPNIIEQQDLLKGLPDARLAMLMQNPAGDIPPFLVAAEAQRRQAIRQQFAGAGSNESVVDTLTKQMSNVPQNIQAPMKTPPSIPAPQMQPQMAQPQMAQPQQTMADGGMVQRYDVGGTVFRGRAGSGGYETPTDPYGIFGDIYDYVAPKLSTFSENMQKFGINPSEQQREELREESAVNSGAVTGGGGILDIEYPDTRIVAGRNPLPPAPKPPKADAGKTGTSPENKYKAQEAAMRDRLEGLYAQDDPTGWEDAQKWFAMSSQFLDPDKTLMQSLASAGAAYAGMSAEEARAQREYDLAREQALLNWDMQVMQSERDAAARAAEKASDREFELLKMKTPEASSAIRAIGDLIEGIDKQLENGMMLDEATKSDLLKQREGYAMQLANIMRTGGFGASGVITRDQLP